jgi:CRP-like cAMP-binding protein
VSYPKGVPLFRQGDEVRSLLLLVDGIVTLHVPHDGAEALVGVRTAGWLLGAAPAVCGRRHRTIARTMTPCDLRPLGIDAFHRMRLADPAMSDALQDRLGQEVIEQVDRAAVLFAGDARERARQALVELFAAAGVERPDGSVRLSIAVSVTDLASFAASDRGHISRLVAALAEEKLLVREKDWFVIPARSPWLAELARRRRPSRTQ